MIPAVLAGLAIWCLVPASTTARQRALFGGQESAGRPNLAVVAAALTPVAAFVVLGLPLGPLIGVGLAPVVHRSMSRLDGRRTPAERADRGPAADGTRPHGRRARGRTTARDGVRTGR